MAAQAEQLGALRRGIAELRAAATFEQAMGVATALMPLRGSAELGADARALVEDTCRGAIAKAEQLKAAAAPPPAVVADPAAMRPAPEPEPEPQVPAPAPVAGGAVDLQFALDALTAGNEAEGAGRAERAGELYSQAVERLLKLRGSLPERQREMGVKLTAECVDRLERLRARPAPATSPPPVWTVPAAPFIPPDMPALSDEEDEQGGGGWLGGVFSSGPSEAERAEKKRADAAIREQARMRAQMQLMEAQLRQQQQQASWQAQQAQQAKARTEELEREKRTREMYESFTADQHAQLEAHVKTMLADGAASNEIEARTALEKHGGDAALARDWLAQQAKAAGGLAEVTWASDVHLDDYSNMEQVKPGVWLASRVVLEGEGGVQVEVSRRCVLKKFVLQENVQPFLRRMAALKELAPRASELVLCPQVWFKDDASTAGVCTAYVEMPRLETPVPLKDTALCSGGGAAAAVDDADAPPDPGSRVKLDGRTGMTTGVDGFAGGKVEVRWDDDLSTSRHKPRELTVVQAAFEAAGSMMPVPELFKLCLQAVVQLHAHGIVGCVAADSVVVEVGGSGSARPVLTAGLARNGIDETSGGEGIATASCGAPELADGVRESWSEKTDIWVVGSLLHRALYEGKEAMLEPGKSQPALPPASDATDEHARDLVGRLLQREPSARLTATAALAHPFFSGGAAVEALKEEGQVVAVETKLAILREHIELLKQAHQQRSLALRVNRTSLVESVLTQIMRREPADLLQKIRVTFEGEAGIDAGGLRKELYTNFAHELFDPEKCGLFESSDDSSTTPCFLPAADFDGDMSIFEGVGRMLAKMLLAGYPEPAPPHGGARTEAVPISLPLAPSLLRFLLYQKPTEPDWRDYARDHWHSTQMCLAMEPQEFDDAMLCLTFEDATPADDPRHEEDVTASNRKEYAEAKLMYELVTCRLPQLTAIRKGFEDVPLRHQLRLFSVTELMDVMCGQQSVDAEEVVDALEFSGFPRRSRTPEYMKQTVRSWSEKSLKCFLRFVTAQTCVPPDGGKIKIQYDGSGAEAYPKSHTCFNRLDMPDYDSSARVTQRLQFCVDNVDNAGFGEA